jgi:hypothetical protein
MKKILAILLIFLASVIPANAQTFQDAQNAIGTPNPGVPELELGAESGAEKLTNYAATVINTALVIGLIGALIYLIYGGIRWIMAGGDPKAMEAAKATMTSAIIGIVLLGIAYAMGAIFQTILGTPTAIPGPPIP